LEHSNEELNEWEFNERIHRSLIIAETRGPTVRVKCVSETSPLSIAEEVLGKTLDGVLDCSNEWLKLPNIKKPKQFTSLTKSLLWRYIAVVLYMGLVPHPKIQLYWATKSKEHPYGVDQIKELMSRDLFIEVSRTIHCDINLKDSHFEQSLNNQFKKLYDPDRFLIVDETLIGFKGRRWRFLQHIPTKPKATGVKLYLCADSDGYVLSFWVYKGKEDSAGKAKVNEIVKDFIQDFQPSKKHVLIADSYFGSLHLAMDLHDQGYHFIINCRKDRPGWLWKANSSNLKKKVILFEEKKNKKRVIVDVLLLFMMMYCYLFVCLFLFSFDTRK
jgi:hypothetical protein